MAIRYSSWLWYYAINSKVVDLISYKITGYFKSCSSYSHTTIFGSTQPLGEINTMNVSGGKVWPDDV